MGSQFDVAPTELARILSCRGYKDLAPPTEHLRILRLLAKVATDPES